MIRRTKAQLLSLLINPFPFGIPMTPSAKRGLLNLSRFYAAGQNCFVSLVGDVDLNWNRVLFCFEWKRKEVSQRPNDTEKHHLNRISLPHTFHLAGTQTALPSVPAPVRVSFAVVPAPFLDSQTFFPGKKVLARFLWYFLCVCKESTEKNTLLILSFCLTIRWK